MTRSVFALARCAVLVVLSVAGTAYGIVLMIGATLVVPYPFVVPGQYRLSALGRRLARTWGGVDLPDVDRPPPPVPHQREDGWYVHDRALFRSPVVPALLMKLDQHANYPLAGREWLWLLLTPFGGGLAVLLPPALLVAGGYLLVRSPWPPGWAVPVASAAVLAAFLLAPAGLRGYGRWTSLLLTPGEPWWRRSASGQWVSRASRATWRGAGLAGLSLGVGLGGLLVTLVSLIVSWGGLLLYASMVTRPMVEFYRRLARQWTGVDLPTPYRPHPPPPDPGEDGSYRVGRSLYPDQASAVRGQRHGWVFGDPATWRDLLWAAGSAVLAPLSFVPAILLGFGFFGLVWQPLSWAVWGVPIGLFTGYWITPFYLWYGVEYLLPAVAWVPGWVSLPIGLTLSLFGLGLAGPLVRMRRWWDRLLLTPAASSVLASRVAHLTTTRAEAVDVQAAELRRIERDLHDGAQARLVAIGLGLASAERLMETDPVRARQLLARTRETSVAALTELRDLVRGIHPPVLAERGLGDAVRAVALDTPLPVRVDIDFAGRLAAPVESAAYFATCEALANAARVAAHVSISLSQRAGLLRIVVTDDGPGGADPARGTGLRGIVARLGTFDGTMTLHSPPGGPTVVTMEVPCV